MIMRRIRREATFVRLSKQATHLPLCQLPYSYCTSWLPGLHGWVGLVTNPLLPLIRRVPGSSEFRRVPHYYRVPYRVKPLECSCGEDGNTKKAFR